MGFLTDTQIKDLVKSSDLVEPKPDTTLGLKTSPIQPASIDFTIGEMRIKDGETNPIVEETCLKTGSMVIVATQESLFFVTTLFSLRLSALEINCLL